MTGLSVVSSRRAHPRSRGENQQSKVIGTEVNGSSPLTRGKHLFALHAERPERLIPAHAGKTPRREAAALSRSAHPRSRGENGRGHRGCQMKSGSSPLTRGKRWPRGWPTRCARLIPAHAGKTMRSRRRCSPPSAHPRSRGENGNALVAAVNPTGSSPLTRGKRPK